MRLRRLSGWRLETDRGFGEGDSLKLFEKKLQQKLLFRSGDVFETL